jgi:hypothetical protein
MLTRGALVSLCLQGCCLVCVYVSECRVDLPGQFAFFFSEMFVVLCSFLVHQYLCVRLVCALSVCA